ncbi:tau 95 subunit of transcription factor TFIIIC [Neopestalotiopsis sp. 37M]|nr:tau 95 subunit of transcription factor TFIIIC [Neopestalotiopsis sp. 37M]
MLGLKDLFPKQGPKQNPNAAPYFEAAPLKIVAVEHPCVVKNTDNGLKTFGRNPNFERLMDDETGRIALPMWLRPDVPTTKPLMSHNAASNNVVLKITVPKRTGRKRKRGTDEPWTGVAVPASEDESSEHVCSEGREDDPKLILRKLQDTAGRYQAEAIGTIHDTHRYHGLADFQFSATEMPYLTKVTDHILPLKVDKLRELRFDPNLHPVKGQEIIPPPYYTDRVVPFNYFYEQNPYVRVDGVDEHGKAIMVNVQGRLAKTYGHYIEHDYYPIPTGPSKDMANSRQVPKDLLERMRAALEERPIWTRRALITRVAPYYSDNSLKIAVQLVGYQFKGGPWRDAVIKYGVDPRSDPQYRVYQTLAFKLEGFAGDRQVKNGIARSMAREEASRSHLWDGTQYCTNGKFWQICDITDPCLVKLIGDAPLRDECDIATDGWWYGGTWAKIKAFMKAKMVAIRHGRLGFDEDEVKKKNFLYNSDILQKLNRYADIQPQHARGQVNPSTLLYDMVDVAGMEGLKYRHRPLTQANDLMTAMGFRGRQVRRPRKKKPEEEAGDGPRPDDDGLAIHKGGSGSEAEEEEEADGAGEEGESGVVGGTGSVGEEDDGDGSGEARFPDDAWAHILDSDLEEDMEGGRGGGGGGDEDGDEDEEEDDDFDESMMLEEEDEGEDGDEGDEDDDDTAAVGGLPD